MADQTRPRRTGILWPVLRSWIMRRPYRVTLVDGDDHVSMTVPRLRRLLTVRRHYLAMGFR